MKKYATIYSLKSNRLLFYLYFLEQLVIELFKLDSYVKTVNV